MLPPASGAFELAKPPTSPDTSSEPALLSATGYQYSSYREFPVAVYKLAIFKQGDRKNPLRLVNLDLKPDTFYTVLISPQGGKFSVEVIDDTIKPKATSGTLVIRNYFSGLSVDADSSVGKIVSGLPYGQIFASEGFPLQKIPVTLRTKLPNGTPIQSVTELDFTVSKHATLVVIPDPYGRFRPRMSIDGVER
jgi:hypothetical protein